MLILKAPITLKCNTDMVSSGEAFYHRITGNYQMMASKVEQEDLLHIVTAPPEVYLGEGGMTSIVSNTNIENRQETKLEVINNLLNRIVLTEDVDLTYQDRVYITDVLHKLGIRNVQQFMTQVSKVKQETQSTQQLINLYWNNLEELAEMVEEYHENNRYSKSVEESSQNQTKFYLHEDILNRLETGDIYQILNNFYDNYSGNNFQVTAQALNITEQKRVSSNILLNRLKQVVREEEVPFVYRHENYYETMELEENQITDEAVNSQITSAVLLNLVDNLYLNRYAKHQENHDTWVDLSRALYQNAENTLQRLKQEINVRQENRTSRELFAEYQSKMQESEIQVVRQLLSAGEIPPIPSGETSYPYMGTTVTAEGEDRNPSELSYLVQEMPQEEETGQATKEDREVLIYENWYRNFEENLEQYLQVSNPAALQQIAGYSRTDLYYTENREIEERESADEEERESRIGHDIEKGYSAPTQGRDKITGGETEASGDNVPERIDKLLEQQPSAGQNRIEVQENHFNKSEQIYPQYSEQEGDIIQGETSVSVKQTEAGDNNLVQNTDTTTLLNQKLETFSRQEQVDQYSQNISQNEENQNLEIHLGQTQTVIENPPHGEIPSDESGQVAHKEGNPEPSSAAVRQEKIRELSQTILEKWQERSGEAQGAVQSDRTAADDTNVDHQEIRNQVLEQSEEKHFETSQTDARQFNTVEGDMVRNEQTTVVDETQEGNVTLIQKEDNTELLRQQLEQINQQNIENYRHYQQFLNQQGKQKTASGNQTERMRRDSLRALADPAGLLNEYRQEEERRQQQNEQIREMSKLLPESTRKIYERMEEIQQNRKLAGAKGQMEVNPVGLLLHDIEQVEHDNEIRTQTQTKETERVRELSETVLDKWSEYPAEDRKVNPRMEMERRDVSLVHKSLENVIDEEMLQEMMEQNRTVNSRTQVSEHVNEERQVIHTATKQQTIQTITKENEDINELIQKGVQRQMGMISDQIYSRLEKRLQNEKKRRGY